MYGLKLGAAALTTLLIAGCQTTVVRQEAPRGPAVGETRIVQGPRRDLAVTLRRAEPGFRRFLVQRADGQPIKRSGDRSRAIAVDATKRAFPRGTCGRNRSPQIADANYRPRRGAWAVSVRCL